MARSGVKDSGFFSSSSDYESVIFKYIGSEADNSNLLQRLIEQGVNVNVTRTYSYENKKIKKVIHVKNETPLHFAVKCLKANELRILLKSEKVNLQLTAEYDAHRPLTAYGLLIRFYREYPENPALEECLRVFGEYYNSKGRKKSISHAEMKEEKIPALPKNNLSDMERSMFASILFANQVAGYEDTYLRKYIQGNGNVNVARSYSYEQEYVINETLSHFAIRRNRAHELQILLSSGRVNLDLTAQYNNLPPLTIYEYIIYRMYAFPKDKAIKDCLTVFNEYHESLTNRLRPK